MPAKGTVAASTPSPTSKPIGHAAGSSARTTLISVSSAGGQGDDNSSYGVTLSANGRIVAFVSAADNLVPGDTNTRDDVFVRDTKSGITSRINVSSTGAQGDGIRILPPSVSIDGAGRYVAFQSDDTNLVAGRANTCTVVSPGSQPCPGIFVRDLRSGTTRLVNVSDGGVPANGYSQFPVISSNGRYVAFISGATNLVDGDTNNAADVFVADLKTSTIRRVSVSEAGVQANGGSYSVSISADGRYVAFNAKATTLTPGMIGTGVIGVFFRDLETGRTQLVGKYGTPVQDNPGSLSMSANGRYVAFDSIDGEPVSGSGNRAPGMFLRDMRSGALHEVSVNGGGGQGAGFSDEPALDAAGTRLAFTFKATGPSTSSAPTQIRLRDLSAGTTRVVSVSDAGGEGSGNSFHPAISGDGRYIGFNSNAINLSRGDANYRDDVFIRGPLS